MKTKFIMSLVAGGLVLNGACSPRETDNGTYESGPGGAAEEAAATDRAETTVATTDSTPVIILTDSLKKAKGGL